MPRIKITSSQNHVVFCENEDELFETMQEFESYLMREGMKPFVQIGSVYMDNTSFDFRITTEDKEEKEIIYAFFNIKEPSNSQYKYRILVQKGSDIYYYPFNDIKTALIVFKVLEIESHPSTAIELVKYHPHKEGDWVVWRDRNRRTAKELDMRIGNGEMIVD